jgi:peptidoglycan/LPS O-acetylase OafA/YrhL
VFALTNYAVSWFIPAKTGTYFALTRLIGVSGAVVAAMLVFHFVERHFARNLVTDKNFWPPLASRVRAVALEISGRTRGSGLP